MDQIKREFHQIEDVLLPNFKRDQKFAKKDNEAINSFKIAENDLITRIRELFTKLRTFIDGAHFHRYGNNGNAAVNDAKQLYNQLCKMSLIIIKQPSSVLQSTTFFNATVCVAIPEDFIVNEQLYVHFRIITAKEAEKLQSDPFENINKGISTLKNTTAKVEIYNGEAPDALRSASTILTAKFKSKIDNITKLEIEKYSMRRSVLLFYISKENVKKSEALGRYGCEETIWALSNTVVLTTASYQKNKATALCIWDRHFGKNPTAFWPHVAETIRFTFVQFTKQKVAVKCASSKRNITFSYDIIKRQLVQEDLEAIKRNWFKPDNSGLISVSQFAYDDDIKEERIITTKAKNSKCEKFYDWFMRCLESITTHLPYWEKNFLMGFDCIYEEEEPAKTNLQSLAAEKKSFFLMRLSQRELSTIVVSVYEYDRNKNEVLNSAKSGFTFKQVKEIGSLVRLLKAFQDLREISFICRSNYTLVEKSLLFEDADMV